MFKLITTASDVPPTQTLVKSLLLNGWDYELLIHDWVGFGDKILKTYSYLKNNPHINYFIYCDAYDVIAIDSMANTLKRIRNKDKIIVSAERNCWPDPDRAINYPETKSPWKYVNSGCYFGNAEMFKKMVEENPIQQHTDDQRWFTDQFLKGLVELDSNCNIFQSIAFGQESDFELKGNKLINTITKTKPVFIHGNGRTDMSRWKHLAN